MKLHELTKTTKTSKQRVGRGYGSGKGGHTSTRGQKGQKSRSKIPQWFTGTSWVWFKRLPMIKGKGKFKSVKKKVFNLNLTQLECYKDGETVNPSTLVKKGVVSEKQAKQHNFKLLNNGKLTKKLKVDIPATKSAIKTIKKLGGEYLRETE